LGSPLSDKWRKGKAADTVKTQPDVDFQTSIQCVDLSELLDIHIDGSSRYALPSSTILFPAIEGETLTDPRYGNVNKYRIVSAARKYIRLLNRIIAELPPGPVCFIVRVTDGIGTDIDRIIRWFEQFSRRVYFIFLLNESEPIVKNEVGVVQGWLACGFNICFFLLKSFALDCLTRSRT